MENNDQNLKNQVNANNNVNQQTSNNTNKIVIILMALVIVGLVGYIVYIKFIQRENTGKPIDNNTQENGKQNSETEKNNENNSKQNEQNSNSNNTNNNNSNSQQNNSSSNIKLEGLTFKTSDGKNTLKIVSKNDKDAISKAKKIGMYENYADEIDYLGYYNGKIMLLFYDNPDGKEINNSNSKYIVLGGQSGQGGQCRDSDGFIVNILNNTLVNLSKGSEYKVHKVGEKYYFSEGDCALTFLPIGVYDENLKRIGYYFLNSDSAENIYVLDNDQIIKYDKSGAVVKKSNQKYTRFDINYQNTSYGSTLYIIAKINEQLYLVDVTSEEKYALNGLDEDFAGLTEDKDSISMDVNNDIIEISRYTPEFDEQNNDWVDKYTTVYTFNPSTKTLLKK